MTKEFHYGIICKTEYNLIAHQKAQTKELGYIRTPEVKR